MLMGHRQISAGFVSLVSRLYYYCDTIKLLFPSSSSRPLPFFLSVLAASYSNDFLHLDRNASTKRPFYPSIRVHFIRVVVVVVLVPRPVGMKTRTHTQNVHIVRPT